MALSSDPPQAGSLDAGPSDESNGREGVDDRARQEVLRRAIASFQAGAQQNESFKLLFDTYYRPVQGFFHRRLRATESSFDLTQETFLRIYKGLRGYRGEGPPGAWVYTIARNVLHRYRTRRTPTGSLSRPDQLDEGLDEGSGPAGEREVAPGDGGASAFAAVLDSERREILRKGIAKLPPKRRLCVVLWAYHDRSYEQIADQMGLSVGTVKAHLAQARKQLLSLVEVEDEDRE